MGLIKAALNALGGTLEDQYKEYIYCQAMPNDILVTKGHKKTSSRSTNKGDDNIITDGSVIAVNEGQCALIVTDGKVAEVAAESGVFTFKSSESPSVFSGNLGDSLLNSLKDVGSRIAFGGMAGRDQRVYYVNLLEIMGNKYGTAVPIPFRVVDQRACADFDVGLRCNGEYGFRIVNPVLFFTNVCSNVAESYSKTNLEGMLKAEIVSALQQSLGKFSVDGIRPSMLPGHVGEITEELNAALAKKWEPRGITVSTFTMNPPSLSKEDQEMLNNLQRTAAYTNANMAGAALVDAQAKAMQAAASNPGGAAIGFMNMNMAQQAGGMNAAQLFQMGAQQQAMQMQQQSMGNGMMQQSAPAAGSWKCECGTANTGKFCQGCGKPKPAAAEGWSCSCGAVNQGKFCQNCGKPKPAGAPIYRCDKCGWNPPDPANPPKFCPECGDPFDANDLT